MDKGASNEIQCYVTTILNHGGFAPHKVAFGSNLVAPYQCGGNDRGLDFAQYTSVSSRFTLQWKLRSMAREATLKEGANGKLRRILDRNKTFNSAGFAIGDSVISHGQINRKSAPTWWGPTFSLDIDETGFTVNIQSQTFDIARYRVPKRVVSTPGTQIGTRDMEDKDAPTSVEEPAAAEPQPAATEVMSPVKANSGAPKHSAICSGISGMTGELANPPVGESNPDSHFYGDMSYEEPHMTRRQHGYHNRDLRSILIARPLAIGQIARGRARGGSRSKVRNSVFVADKEVAKPHGQCWDSAMGDSLGALPDGPADGVDAAVSAWAADLCNKTLRREPPEGEETKYALLARAAQDREPAAGEKFDAISRTAHADIRKTIVGARWILFWEDIGGGPSVKGRSVVEGSQDKDLQEGLVETAGCVSFRSSHLQLLSLRQANLGLGKKNACLQSDSSRRDVSLHAPPEWGPQCSMRTRKPRVAALGLNDAQAAFYNTLRRYLSDTDQSNEEVGLAVSVSDHHLCLLYVIWATGQSVGAMATRADDTVGCGKSGIMGKVGVRLAERFGLMGI